MTSPAPPEAPRFRLRRSHLIAFLLVDFLVTALLLLIFLPPGLIEKAPPSAAELAAFEERGAAHFARIEAARNLELAFPEPRRPVGQGATTAEQIELGRLLYFDPVLSGANDQSCAHCHHPDLGFSDNRARAMGKGGQGIGPARTGGVHLRRGSPTVWNAAFSHVQFWDGRADTLEDQAVKPILDPNEMASEAESLLAELRGIPEYVRLFGVAFAGEGATGPTPEAGVGKVSLENIGRAIAAFERTVISQDSRFDRYARGERTALSETERRGWNVFRSLKTRCFECHNLPTFANPDFKVVGVPDPPDLGNPDLGRAEIAGGDAYQRAFKVPTLRNVAITAPYMHNGHFSTLAEVIDFYAQGGGPGAGLKVPNLDDKIRPFTLSAGDKADLIAFLHTLTDESKKPEFPPQVPSGLPVVERSGNLSPELLAFTPKPEPPREVAIRRSGQRLFVESGQRIQDAIDLAQAGDVIEIAPGVYHETLTLDLSGITLEGRIEGDRRAVLDGRGVLADGIIGSGSDLVFSGLAVRNYTANGIMVNLGKRITFRDLELKDTGLYGLYPVEVLDVLIEGCKVEGARDAGIYVGQSSRIVVRGNRANGNVTGIEIENSTDALVENNEIFGNTGGILVFGLPNNPSKLSRGCRVERNHVYDNNLANFADKNAVVAGVPAGTGILVLAGDDVEIAHNRIKNNDSFAIGVAGLDMLFGPGSNYDIEPHSDRVFVHDNEFAGNGGKPAPAIHEAGLDGADLLWDLQGEGHRFDAPGASQLPPILPKSGWSPWQERLNRRFWLLVSQLTG